jgi:hypothetical protein
MAPDLPDNHFEPLPTAAFLIGKPDDLSCKTC